MTALVFLFPGQGAQRPGMGSTLDGADRELLAARLARADATVDLPIAELCATGSADDLRRTEVAQPALFALELTLADIAVSVGLRPGAVAGHSLGECTAAVAAGVLTPEEGSWLVAWRGRLMARAQRERPGAMAAILGPAPDAVAALCAAVDGPGSVGPANYNAPRQTVVAGDEGAVERLLALVAERCAGRGVRLPVAAAFHSELMRPARDRLGDVMAVLPWRDPAVPVAANATGTLMDSAAGVREALLEQIAAPVQWVACVRALVDAGHRHFLELGPGRVLSGLVRQIAPDADVAAADSRAAIEAYAAERAHLLAA